MTDKHGHYGISFREDKVRYSRNADLIDVLERSSATGVLLSRQEPIGLTSNVERQPD